MIKLIRLNSTILCVQKTNSSLADFVAIIGFIKAIIVVYTLLPKINNTNNNVVLLTEALLCALELIHRKKVNKQYCCWHR